MAFTGNSEKLRNSLHIMATNTPDSAFMQNVCLKTKFRFLPSPSKVNRNVQITCSAELEVKIGLFSDPVGS